MQLEEAKTPVYLVTSETDAAARLAVVFDSPDGQAPTKSCIEMPRFLRLSSSSDFSSSRLLGLSTLMLLLMRG